MITDTPTRKEKFKQRVTKNVTLGQVLRNKRNYVGTKN
jgi:hypothetical protein